LERERINDEKKLAREDEKKWRSKTHLVIESMENTHLKKMTMLKEDQKEIKKNAEIFMKTRQ
jgi:cell shape-determining protein MreC